MGPFGNFFSTLFPSTFSTYFWDPKSTPRGLKNDPGRHPNRHFGVQMGPFPSLRSSFASPFDVGPNLKRLEANLLQVSCHSCFRLALFSNIAHVTKHCKTQWISMIFQSSSLHARCEKEANDEAKPRSQRRAAEANLANFYITWRPFLAQKSSLEGKLLRQRAHRTAMSRKCAKSCQNGIQKGPQNEPKSTLEGQIWPPRAHRTAMSKKYVQM